MVDNFLHLGVTQGNCVLAFDMETLSGADLADLSGNTNVGVITGTTIIKNGSWGNARTFNGTSDIITVIDDPLLDFGTATDFTVSIWVKATATPALAEGVIGKQVTFSFTSAGWQLVYENDGGNERMRWLVSDGTDNINTFFGDNLNDGLWHHIAVTNDRSGNALHYVDGVLKATTSMTAIDNVDNASDLVIGEREANEFFGGDIDEVYIYARILTAAEVSAIARAPRTRLTSPDGATKIPLLDSRTSMDITRTVTMPSITGNQVIDIDLRIAKRTFGVTGKATPYGAFTAPEILGEIERLMMTYASQANNPRIPSANTQGARMDFEWGHRNSNEDWKRYFVRSAKMTPVKDNVADGGADRIFNYQLAFSEGGKLSARGDPDELAG